MDHQDIETPSTGPSFDWYTVTGGKYVKQDSAQQPSGTSPGSPSSAPRKPRLPPLPVSDYKVVIRPRGLNLAEVSPVQLSLAVQFTTKAPIAITKAWKVRIDPDQNIAIIGTPSQAAANNLATLTVLHLGGKVYEVRAYQASPHDSVRGVIHGIPAEADSEYLMEMVCAHDATLIQARRMGKSNSALLTFAGKRLPRYIFLAGGELRCYPYMKSTLYCSRCRSTKHRTDVCPVLDTPMCARCGQVHSPNQSCEPRCAVCGEAHLSGSKECRHRHRLPPSKPQDSSSRGRSTSRKRSASRGRQKSSPRDSSRSLSRNRSAHGPQVTWAKLASGSPNTSSTPTPSAREEQLLKENGELKKQIHALQQEVSNMAKAIQTLNATIQALKQCPSTPSTPAPAPLSDETDESPKRKARRAHLTQQARDKEMETDENEKSSLQSALDLQAQQTANILTQMQTQMEDFQRLIQQQTQQQQLQLEAIQRHLQIQAQPLNPGLSTEPQ